MYFNTSYPVDALSPIIRDAVYEVQSHLQAPAPLIAASALSAVAIACQGILDVRSPIGSVTPTSLFFLSIADSGERKSSTDKLFSQPIFEFQQEQYEHYQQKLPLYESQLAAWKVELDAIQSELRSVTRKEEDTTEIKERLAELFQNKPEPLIMPKLVYADTTIEALLYGLYKHTPYAALISSEASTVLTSALTHQLAHLNTLWDGDTVSVDRKTQESFMLRGSRLSTTLMIQNKPFQQFLKRNDEYARQSGFLARMLVTNPGSTQGDRTNLTEMNDSNTVFLKAFQQRITEILQQTVNITEDQRITLEFLPEAKEVWSQFHLAGESWIYPLQPWEDIKDAVSKISNNMARMAALLHYFSGKNGAIDKESTQAAFDICRWHINEFARLFSVKNDISIRFELANLLYNWLWKRYQQSGAFQCCKKDIYHYGPNRLRNRDALESAIQQLASENKIFYYSQSKPIFVELNLHWAPPMVSVPLVSYTALPTY